MATDDNFEEVAPKPSAVPPARSRADRVNGNAYSSSQISERADQLQSSAGIHPDLDNIDASPQGRANAARIEAEGIEAEKATEEFNSRVRAVPTKSEVGAPLETNTGYTDNAYGATRKASTLAATNDPYVPGGLKPPTARPAEFNEQGEAKSEGEKMRSGLDASMTQGLAELNEQRQSTHNRSRMSRISRRVMGRVLPVFYEHEELHAKGNKCTKPECADVREKLAAGAVDKDGFRTEKTKPFTFYHFRKAHPEVQEEMNRIKEQVTSEPRNADYEPIDEAELKSKPNLLHLVRLQVLGKWTGLGPQGVRESFSSIQPKQQARTKQKLENEVNLETALPGSIKGRPGVEGPAFTAPVAPKDWMLGVDSDTVINNVKGTFDIMRGAHHAAKGRGYDVSRRLGGNKPMEAKMEGIHERDTREAAARIAQREILSERGLVGQAADLKEAKLTGFDEAKQVAARQQAVRDAQETRRRGGPGAFRDVPAAGEDPRLDSDKARARQAASIARHLPHVLQDMADAHNNGVIERETQLGGTNVEGPLQPSREQEARSEQLGGYNVQGPLQTPVHVNVNTEEVAKRLTPGMVGEAKSRILKSGVQGSMSALENRQVKPRRETDEVVPTTPTPESEISGLREKAVGEANDNIQRVKQLGGRQFEGPLRKY